MPRTSRKNLAIDRLDDSERFVDLRLHVVEVDEECERTGRTILKAGGRWDRRLSRYVAGVKTAKVVEAHPGQVPFVEWWEGWLADHVAGRKIPKKRGDPCPYCEAPARAKNIDKDEKVYKCHACKETWHAIYSALLAGGQRAGKTHIGTTVTAISYALEKPGSITWIVCPTDKDFEEIEDYLESTMPKEWYKKIGAPWYRYTLPNGSKIVLRSGHAPQSLKKGRADLIVGNEMQRMKLGAFGIMRARIADKGGIVIGLANPPDTQLGAWVGDWAVEAEAGLRQSKYFYFDPFLNPFINHGPLNALRDELDEHTFDVEVLGKFLTSKDVVFYNWNRFENEIRPTRKDITHEVTEMLEGMAFDRVVGVDVQKHPYMASVEFKFFENPMALGGLERVYFSHMWATKGVLLDASDEYGLADEWLAMGWNPRRTLIVCDASGEWQFAERNSEKVGELRRKTGGRGSFDAFRSKGFIHIVKPDRGSEKNPEIVERARTATARIKTAAPGEYGQHFLYSVPENKRLNACIRNWPTHHGKPSRSSEFAHAGDAFTYPVIRFFPRGQRMEKKGPKIRMVTRSNASSRMRGW